MSWYLHEVCVIVIYAQFFSIISAESGFAARLFNCCRTFVHEFIVLNRYILRGGQESLQALVQERLVRTGGFVCFSACSLFLVTGVSEPQLYTFQC
jgi:hypothetical protein